MDTNIQGHLVGIVVLIILGCIGQVHGKMFAFFMFIMSVNIKSSSLRTPVIYYDD